MDQRNLNGKGLMVSISEEPRSISPSPQPHGGGSLMMMPQHSDSGASFTMGGMPHSHSHAHMGMGGGGGGQDPEDSPYVQEQDDDSGEGEPSQFGRAKKTKRKAAPRTSRACLACRRQKMRCEGAENPPCRRCIANEVDCMFERRSDYLLNPEDRAWQNGVEKRLEHLSRTIDMLLAHLAGQAMPGPPNTAGPSFPEMPSATAPYYESYERHGMPPNTAPPGTAGGPGDMGHPGMGGMSGGGGGRINYVVPSPAETAAIAAQAQARARRGRGNTLPNLPSAGFPPDSSGFQLFSPRTAGLETGLPNPFTYGAPTPGPPPSAHPHHAHHHGQHPHQQQQQQQQQHPQPHPGDLGPPHHGHPHHHPHGPGGGGQAQYAHTPSHAYSFDTYPGGPGGPSGAGGGGSSQSGGGGGGPGSHGHGSFNIEHDGGHSGNGSVAPQDHQQMHQRAPAQQNVNQSNNGAGAQGGGADLVPRSLSSPNVRFAHHQSMARDDMHGDGLGAAPLHGTESTA